MLPLVSGSIQSSVSWCFYAPSHYSFRRVTASKAVVPRCMEAPGHDTSDAPAYERENLYIAPPYIRENEHIIKMKQS